MTIRIGNLRESFDRDMDFVAVKPFAFSGAKFIPGQPFDKTQVSTRRLRQLYDSRYLRMVEPEERTVTRDERIPTRVEIGNMVPPVLETKSLPRVQRVTRKAS